MTFDFYNEYQRYSNADLLKIVRLPDEYQPVAVETAWQILREREVAPEEIDSMDQSLQAQLDAERYKKEKFDRVKAQTLELFPPLVQTNEKFEARKWLNLLLLGIAIQYVWTLFQSARRLIQLLAMSGFSGFYLLEFISVFYIPLIFYLLFKRRRWGWIMLYADNLFTLILLLSESYDFFKYQSIHHGSTVSFITPILIRSAFVFFLWRDVIAEHFAVSVTTKKQTAMVAASVALLFVAIG